MNISHTARAIVKTSLKDFPYISPYILPEVMIVACYLLYGFVITFFSDLFSDKFLPKQTTNNKGYCAIGRDRRPRRKSWSSLRKTLKRSLPVSSREKGTNDLCVAGLNSVQEA